MDDLPVGPLDAGAKEKVTGVTSGPRATSEGGLRDPGAAPRPGPDAPPSDEQIVARVRAGDVALFEILMRRHNQRLYRAVRSVIANEADVEEVMQQAYLRAYAALDGFAGLSSFATWLTRIGLNEALARIRKRRWLEPVEDLPESTESLMEPAPTPEDLTSSREMAQLVERAIDRLPPAHRTVIMLREVQQLSTEEAASVLQVSEDVVKVRLHRARLALREALADEAVGSACDAFPFLAPRCDRVVAAVMARLLGDAA
jgi:RNA polymerase sigma-70 factor (ECF subfamily)